MIALTYEYTCDACGKKDARVHKPIMRYCQAPNCSIPDGWRWLEGSLYCDEHEVTITVKKRVRRD